MEYNYRGKKHVNRFVGACGAYALLIPLFDLMGLQSATSPTIGYVDMLVFGAGMTWVSMWFDAMARPKKERRYTGEVAPCDTSLES